VACAEVDGVPVAITGGGVAGRGEVLVWDLQFRSIRHAFAVPYRVIALATGPNNELIVGADREVIVLDRETGLNL
jgi:hypothetical protein